MGEKISLDGFSTWEDYISKPRKFDRAEAIDGRPVRLPAPYHKRDGQKERDIQRDVRRLLKEAGYWHCRLEGGGKIVRGKGGDATMVPSEQAGMPDLLVCVSGRLAALEIKAPGGSLSPGQLACLKALKEAGAMVAVVVCPSRVLWWLDGGGATSEVSGIDLV